MLVFRNIGGETRIKIDKRLNLKDKLFVLRKLDFGCNCLQKVELRQGL